MTELAGRRVLVVEDLFYLAMDVRRALADAGAEVLGPFADLDGATECLASQKPDCAVLDVRLAEGPSFEMARALRARAIPFLFFTGYDESAIPPEFADVPRLEKPMDAARIVTVLRAQLGA